MPAPPRKGESKEKFLARAIPFLVKEGKAQKQAVAIAHSMWGRNHGKTLLTRKK